MEIKYIDNDKNKGILIDWERVKKEYKKLNCPKGVYYPLKPDFRVMGYNVCMSDRSEGKTTNPVLVGMILYKLYGIITHYVRNNTDMLAPKKMGELFATILQFDYVSKITENQYNSVFYYGKKWFYCNRDENGQIIEKSNKHFMYCCGLNESDDMKSSYNCPVGDWIIFDEFIQLSGYGYNDFIAFTDICKTIIRNRLSPVVNMMSNTIDINSPWFDELCIRDDVNEMQMGDIRQLETCEGTHIYLEILPANMSEDRQAVNRRFFGFPNPKLAAITGKGTWASESYPHIKYIKDNETRMIHNKIFVKQSGKLLKLQLMKNPQLGTCVYVVPATKTHNDSWILTHGDITSKREILGF